MVPLTMDPASLSAEVTNAALVGSTKLEEDTAYLTHSPAIVSSENTMTYENVIPSNQLQQLIEEFQVIASENNNVVIDTDDDEEPRQSLLQSQQQLLGNMRRVREVAEDAQLTPLKEEED